MSTVVNYQGHDKMTLKCDTTSTIQIKFDHFLLGAFLSDFVICHLGSLNKIIIVTMFAFCLFCGYWWSIQPSEIYIF